MTSKLFYSVIIILKWKSWFQTFMWHKKKNNTFYFKVFQATLFYTWNLAIAFPLGYITVEILHASMNLHVAALCFAVQRFVLVLYSALLRGKVCFYFNSFDSLMSKIQSTYWWMFLSKIICKCDQSCLFACTVIVSRMEPLMKRSCFQNLW